MDEPIAERSFYVDGAPEQPIVVFRFWKPYQPEGDYPRCAYKLVSPQGVEKGEISGVDSMVRIPRDADQRSELMSITVPK